jgi:hypothetical protein
LLKVAGIIIVVLLVLLLAIAITVKSFDFGEDEATLPASDSKVEQVIASYAANGVEITEDDVTVTVVKNDDGTEETKVEVNNTEAADENRQAINSKLQKSFNSLIPGVSPSSANAYSGAKNYGENKFTTGLDGYTHTTYADVTEDDLEDLESEINLPTEPEDLSEIIKLVNRTSAYLREFEENSYATADELGVTNYFELLIAQRQSGDPSDDTEIGGSTYDAMQKCLNGQAFLGLNQPGTVQNSKEFYFTSRTTASDTLYQNYLKYQYYKTDLDIDSTDINLETITDGEKHYITYFNGSKLQYQTVLRLDVDNVSVYFTLDNLEYIVLDVTPRQETTTTTVVTSDDNSEDITESTEDGDAR